MFIAAWDPPEAWVQDLASISPRLPGISHARLVWEPGFPWMPVQRWAVYDCVPVHGMPKPAYADLAEYLDLEHPCTCAYEWRNTADGEVQCHNPRCLGARSPMRQWIYRRFQDEGLWCQPMWVIQGPHGGHRPMYTVDEKIMATSLGQPDTPPMPGSLPYAPWDNRVKQQILRLDLSTTLLASLRAARGERRDALQRAARQARLDYMSRQFGQIAESTPDRILDQMPRSSKIVPVDWSVVGARYIETGALSGVN